MKHLRPLVLLLVLSVFLPSRLAAAAEVQREEAMKLRAQGYAFQSQGDLANAVSAYQKAVALDPSYPTPFNDMGVVLEEQGKLAEAEQSYLRALKINPTYSEAHANMAMLYERMGDKEKAVYHWLKRFQLGDPENAGTLRAKERLRALGAFTLASDPEAVSKLVAEKDKTAKAGASDKAAGAKGEKAAAEKAESEKTAKDGKPGETTKAEPPKPAEKPKEINPLVPGFMSINEGIETTPIPMVRLKMVVQGIPDVVASSVRNVQFSSDGQSYTTPEPFAAAKPWILTPGDGLKTVYVQLLDQNNKPLIRLYDTITLDTSPLSVLVTGSRGELRERLMKGTFESFDQTEREFQAVTGEQGGWPD